MFVVLCWINHLLRCLAFTYVKKDVFVQWQKKHIDEYGRLLTNQQSGKASLAYLRKLELKGESTNDKEKLEYSILAERARYGPDTADGRRIA